jgi:hypothetical protein
VVRRILAGDGGGERGALDPERIEAIDALEAVGLTE